MSVWAPNFTCYEVFGTRNESWNSDVPRASVLLQCRMSERYLVIADIIAYHRNYPEATPVPLRAVDGSIVLDSAVKISDVAQERFSAGYDAFVEITYMPLNGYVHTQTENENFPRILYAEEALEPSLEFLQDDYIKYGWANAIATESEIVDPPDFKALGTQTIKPNEVPGTAKYKISVERLVRGYKTLPVGWEEPASGQTGDQYDPVPFEKWSGRVHNYAYTSELTGLYFAPGTLLFTQPRISYGAHMLIYLTSGSSYVPYGLSWRISATLLYQPLGWNVFWRNTATVADGDKSGYYHMLYLETEGTTPGEFAVHKPFKYLDMREFIFNSSLFPPDPWPPEVA